MLPTPDQSLGLLTVLWVLLDFSTLGVLAFAVQRMVQPSMQRKLLTVSAALLLLIGLGGLGHATWELWTAASSSP